MSSHSRSTLSSHQREEFLREHGYEVTRGAKGSHAVWVHAALKDCGKTRSVQMPDNLKSTMHQRGWELTLPCDPGPGLWLRLERQAKWAQETAERIQKMEEARTLSRRVKFEFRKAVRDVRIWKHGIRSAYKAGIDIAAFPAAPLDAINTVHSRNHLKDFGLT